MDAGDFSYYALAHPFPEDFVEWYPYIRPGEIAEGSPWLDWLRHVVLDGVPGVRDRMTAARGPEGWMGVVWTSVSETCPELAHFGWFWVDDRCRGLGVGGRIIESCLEMLVAEGVRMVMLPTQLANERAIGMYQRRGWTLSLVDPGGGVWMVREPPGFWAEYFTPDPRRPIQAGPALPTDYVALDYLLSRPLATIRLLPLGLVGNRRFISFVHDWNSAMHMVARQGGRPLALGAAISTAEGSCLDVCGLDRSAMAVAAEALCARVEAPYARVAVTDARRRGALEDAGMRLVGVCGEEQIAGAPVSLCRYEG